MKAHVAIAILATSCETSAFTPPISPSTQRTALHSTISEEAYPNFLSSASACIDSDSCSLEMAENYLREIVRIESACVAGTMNGEACDDVARVSEVVAGLREKIGRASKQSVKTFWQKRQDEFESLVSSSIDAQSNALSPTAALTQAPLKPAYLAIAALYTIAAINILQTPPTASDVVPFTAQEVWWTISDGYAIDLMEAYFKHGGLIVSDNSNGGTISPQEIWWSIRDGYAHNVLSEWFRNGGELTSGKEFVAMTPQEVWRSVKDGYVSDML